MFLHYTLFLPSYLKKLRYDNGIVKTMRHQLLKYPWTEASCRWRLTTIPPFEWGNQWGASYSPGTSGPCAPIKRLMELPDYLHTSMLLPCEACHPSVQLKQAKPPTKPSFNLRNLASTPYTSSLSPFQAASRHASSYCTLYACI